MHTTTQPDVDAQKFWVVHSMKSANTVAYTVKLCMSGLMFQHVCK